LGKSRLIAEARRLWQAGLDGPAEPLSWSESRGISYDRSSPYAQFQQHLSHNIGRVEGEAPAQTAERLQAALAAFWQADAGGDLAETTAVLATLLDVRPAGAEGEGGSLSGEAFKQALYRTYDHLLRQLTGQTPAVRVFEDLHWCDPASLALLERLFELSDYVPLLFICTLRPHRGGAAWSAKNAAERLYPHRLQEIVLAPLSAGDSSALLAGLLDSQDLPARLRETLWEKAEGNPFYLEEIIRELIDGGILVKEPASNGQRRWRVTAEPQAVTIPETLQALLTARIDRLEEGPRHLLQLASVVGRTFSLPLLRASADRPEQLEDYLPALQRADLIRETGRRPEPTYHFRHGLTQEAAYESMLLRQRREAHGRIAAALESRGATDEVAGMLAHHFDRAGQPARAVPYYTHAGERAMRLYASMEASSHFSRALMLAAEGAGYQELAQLRQARAAAYETLGDFEAARSDLEAALELGQSYQDPRVALQASLDLGFLWAARDYERTGIYFNQALELAQASGEPAQLAQALNRVGNWHMNIGRPAEGSRFHEQALAIFEQQGDQQGQAASVDLLAMSNFSSGDLAESSRLFRQATELFRQQGDQRGLASALASLSMYGPASMADLAAPTQTLSEAAAAGREAAQIAAAIGWRAGEAHTLASLGATLGALGDFDEALACARGGLSIARQINHDQWAVGAQVSLASIHEAMLDLNMAADLLGAARDEVRQTGSQIWQDYAVGLHASILIRRGAAAEVGASLLKYLAASADSQLFAFRYIIRAAGELALAQGGPQAALAHFDRLVALAGVPPERLPGLALPYGAALEALSRADEALALLLLALELAEANQARPLAWQMRRALAGLYARLGRPAQAARQREAARELASAMAATISDEGQRQRYLEAAGLAEK
ncbi:MAG: ATP-binding protein, partial [Candidatus Promineifilaceae bacterium]